MLKIVFLGNMDVSVPALRECVRVGQVVGVVTKLDKPGHRGKLAPRPVAAAAEELSLEVFQPEKLRDSQVVVEQILQLNPDVLVVVAYGQIIASKLLDSVRFGGVNVHFSLLPQWRGASPFAAPILAGDSKTGVCVMQMEAGIDTGPIYKCEAINLDSRTTAPMLQADLSIRGAKLLGEVLPQIEAGTIQAQPQDTRYVESSYAPKLKREDGFVSWRTHSAIEIDRKVRAYDPWPGCVVEWDEVRIQLLSVRPSEHQETEPGSILKTEKESVLVATCQGALWLDQVKPEGKKDMGAAAYLRGKR